MFKFVKRIVAFLVVFCLGFEQSGFAQVAPQFNIPTYINGYVAPDKFRPAQLRSISFDQKSQDFSLLLDKGDARQIKPQQVQLTTKELVSYFNIGIALPNSTFWVNLRPDAKDQVIDPWLERTEVGRILLVADLQLKKDMAAFTSPKTREGKNYWNKLYARAEEIFGRQDITIPTITRPWIVPGEILVRETPASAYIFKATLKVMLEQDWLPNNALFQSNDPKIKQLNEYSSAIIRKEILPKLTREVNSSKKYAELRQVYYSLVLAQWFKEKYRGQEGNIASKIDQRDLTGLASVKAWSRDSYFNDYKKSFEKGEYNISETVSTPAGMIIRQYFSGGVRFAEIGQTASTFGSAQNYETISHPKVEVPAGTRFEEGLIKVNPDGSIVEDESTLPRKQAAKENEVILDDKKTSDGGNKRMYKQMKAIMSEYSSDQWFRGKVSREFRVLVNKLKQEPGALERYADFLKWREMLWKSFIVAPVIVSSGLIWLGVLGGVEIAVLLLLGGLGAALGLSLTGAVLNSDEYLTFTRVNDQFKKIRAQLEGSAQLTLQETGAILTRESFTLPKQFMSPLLESNKVNVIDELVNILARNGIKNPVISVKGAKEYAGQDQTIDWSKLDKGQNIVIDVYTDEAVDRDTRQAIRFELLKELENLGVLTMNGYGWMQADLNGGEVYDTAVIVDRKGKDIGLWLIIVGKDGLDPNGQYKGNERVIPAADDVFLVGSPDGGNVKDKFSDRDLADLEDKAVKYSAAVSTAAIIVLGAALMPFGFALAFGAAMGAGVIAIVLSNKVYRFFLDRLAKKAGLPSVQELQSGLRTGLSMENFGLAVQAKLVEPFKGQKITVVFNDGVEWNCTFKYLFLFWLYVRNIDNNESALISKDDIQSIRLMSEGADNTWTSLPQHFTNSAKNDEPIEFKAFGSPDMVSEDEIIKPLSWAKEDSAVEFAKFGKGREKTSEPTNVGEQKEIQIKERTKYLIKGNSSYFMEKYRTSNPVYWVEADHEKVMGKFWADMQGNPAAMLYALRAAQEGLPTNAPGDGAVLYGKIGYLGEMVHKSELEEVDPSIDAAYQKLLEMSRNAGSAQALEAAVAAATADGSLVMPGDTGLLLRWARGNIEDRNKVVIEYLEKLNNPAGESDEAAPAQDQQALPQQKANEPANLEEKTFNDKYQDGGKHEWEPPFYFREIPDLLTGKYAWERSLWEGRAVKPNLESIQVKDKDADIEQHIRYLAWTNGLNVYFPSHKEKILKRIAAKHNGLALKDLTLDMLKADEFGLTFAAKSEVQKFAGRIEEKVQLSPDLQRELREIKSLRDLDNFVQDVIGVFKDSITLSGQQQQQLLLAAQENRNRADTMSASSVRHRYLKQAREQRNRAEEINAEIEAIRKDITSLNRFANELKTVDLSAQSEAVADGGLTSEKAGTVQPEEADEAAVDNPGGVDFRALPIQSQAVIGVVNPALILQSMPQAMKMPLAELDAKWLNIQEKVKSGSMPYQELKEFVAVCNVREDAGQQMKTAVSFIKQVLEMEEERALPTAGEMKEIIQLAIS